MQRGNLDSTKLGLWGQQASEVWGSLGRFPFSSLLQLWQQEETAPLRVSIQGLLNLHIDYHYYGVTLISN